MDPTPTGDARFEQAKAQFVAWLGCLQRGELEAAERHFIASLALLPGRVSTLVNLAATRLRLDRPEQALIDADAVIAIEPASFDGWFHRGDALMRLRRVDDARRSFEQALAIDDRHAEPWLRHGEALNRLGRLDAALASYDRALAIAPDLASAWSQRGTVLREAGRRVEAAAAFRRAIDCGADPELHRWYLASVSSAAADAADAAAAAAPARYVEALFDDYATDFDDHVRRRLAYRAPEAIAGQLARFGAGRRFASVLDLGCGTGLCGPLLKPLAGRLTGVDLSARMLDEARRLGVYDHLVQADIVDHLRDGTDGVDLVVAADVLIYLGDLSPLFGAVQQRIVAGGLFCLSAEEATVNGDRPVELLPTLRYAHSERYLREQAARHGFTCLELLREPIREDQRRPVDGLFGVLQKR